MRQLFLLAVGILLISASARADWTKVETNTTANLWGVCFGGGQYVAVGTSGTILTSPDGTKWTARSSGTVEWLTAVAYGNKLFVAVGDHGTILTSPDAVTWTSRANSGSRLNGIAFGGDRFLAVGEAGTVRASTDAITWSARTLPVNTWLRGVCYGRDAFFIGAGDGTIVSTADGLVFRLVAKSSNSIEAMFYGDGVAFAVGDGSSVEHASDGVTWQQLFGPPFYDAYFATFRGVARIGDVMVAVGVGGMMMTEGYHEWSSDQLSRSLLGSINLNALVNAPSGAVAVGDYGTIYTNPADAAKVVAPNSGQITASAEVLFRNGEMRLTAGAHGTWPFTYQWFHDSRAIPGATSDSLNIEKVTPSDAGAYSVEIGNSAGTTTATIRFPTVAEPASQRVDRTFRANRGPEVTSWRNEIVSLADGGLLVGFGEHPGFGGHSGNLLARINPDGSLDLNFPTVLATDVWRRDILVLADGSILSYGGGYGVWKMSPNGTVDPAFRIIPSDGFPVPLADGNLIVVSSSGDLATLKRYHADGTLDESYVIATVEVDPVHRTPPFDPIFRGGHSAHDSKGRVIVAATAVRDNMGLDQSRLFRLAPDGTLDATFKPVTVEARIRQLHCVGEKIYYYAESLNDPLEQNHFSEIARLNEDGSPDPGYQSLKRRLDYFDVLQNAKNLLLPDGSVLTVEENVVKRYSPAGTLDSSVSLSLGGAGEIDFVGLQNDGRVLIAGSFTSVDGWSTAGIARLNLVSPSHDSASYLANLSIRTAAGSGDQTLIAGFVVAGEGGTRSVLARGVGPGLVPLGLNASEVVTDPQLKLFRGQTAIATNDNWDSSLEPTASALGAYPLARDSKDAALFTALSPGAYTAHVTSTTGASGVALVELYDAGGMPASASSPRLVNLSGRARVGTGDNVLIAGFVLNGSSAKRLLIRAVGPGLRAQGVSDALADPQLTLYHGAEPIATNDDWNSADQPVFKQVGAFDLASGSKDAALVADLVPGVYTAVVRGVNNTTGTALVEIYEVP